MPRTRCGQRVMLGALGRQDETASDQFHLHVLEASRPARQAVHLGRPEGRCVDFRTHGCPNSAHVSIPSRFSRRESVGSRVLPAGDCPPEMFNAGRRFCKTRPAAAAAESLRANVVRGRPALPGGTSLRYNFLIGRSNDCCIFGIARKGLKDGRQRGIRGLGLRQVPGTESTRFGLGNTPDRRDRSLLSCDDLPAAVLTLCEPRGFVRFQTSLH